MVWPFPFLHPVSAFSEFFICLSPNCSSPECSLVWFFPSAHCCDGLAPATSYLGDLCPELLTPGQVLVAALLNTWPYCFLRPHLPGVMTELLLVSPQERHSTANAGAGGSRQQPLLVTGDYLELEQSPHASLSVMTLSQRLPS